MVNGPILVVDDEPDNLAAMSQILANKYSLVFARDAIETLAAVSKHHPCLILLDIQMPDTDGYAVCRTLKADPRTESIPVIFVTSMSEELNEAAGFNAGAVDYITKPVSPSIVRARVATHLSLVRATMIEKSYRESIYMLGEAAHYKDTDTGVHIWRMAAYARELAEACGWNEDDCRLLELAAPMHDTGKLAIPDAILCKPDKLNAEEWDIMKTHTRIGANILAKSDSPVFRMAAEIALRHHEKWDGTGYPDGLAGEAIPKSARITAVVDVFDALSMKRPYKEPWPLDLVMDNLHQQSGSHFEPRLIEIFNSILPQILEIKATWDTLENQH
ncbi:HD domain-containing phosphohydrolase [Methylomonas methanica]|uniref:Response regulator receiver modulated metal dependent phosphohydrolase n=1 Tax=Methylomonas methanica (strain DSM 25384 / MC09) TaxID=857087 RepID=F9ZZ24_METMM|nr:HD domain-containing phosphohydrolase [Methylomonas methanica]AEF99879.1 response regulator receiver modulated metal dependent phosphohydrolase [Methylomonas methanica MC09]